MNIVHKLSLRLASGAMSFIILASPAVAVVSAAPLFEESKKEACAGAQLTKSASADCSSGAQQKLDKTLDSIINLFSLIIGIIAVIMVIVSGFRYITSNGDSNAIGTAKNTLIYAIVGLIIVALAQVIVRFVLDKI